jgi:hypothetical protein
LSFLYGTIFTGPALARGHHSRNVTVFAAGEVDRSATGSGVSARAALHYAAGELALNETITVERILGNTMGVRATEETRFGCWQAIIPEVRGTASFTGSHTFYLIPPIAWAAVSSFDKRAAQGGLSRESCGAGLRKSGTSFVFCAGLGNAGWLTCTAAAAPIVCGDHSEGSQR